MGKGLSHYARKSLIGFCFDALEYRPRLRASEWISENLVLPPGKNETEPGRVTWDRRPYLVDVIDDIERLGISDVIFVAPTRIGKTFILRMCMAVSIAKDPAPALFIDSTEPKGRGFIRKEFRPLIEHNKILRARKPANRHYYGDGMMLFPGAALTVFGANSDAQVSGETVKRIFGNEVDKWRGSTDEEASIIEQTRHRTESFDDERKHYYSSTPTLETGTIWQEYLKGDQRRWHVPCPDCGHLQQLEWNQVDWAWNPETRDDAGEWDLDKVKEHVRYRCAADGCDALWTQAELWAAVRDPRACWVPTAKGRTRYRSYQINGLYGPKKANTMAELAEDFLTSRQTGFYTDRQDFWNSRMGLPWKEDVSELTVEKFAALEGNYERGTLPDVVQGGVLIVGADVQTWGLPYVVDVYSWDGMCYTIDHGVAATFADLEEIQKGYLELARSAYVIVDINFEDRAAETREAIYTRKHLGWLAAEGFEIMAKDLVKLEMANAFIGGRAQSDNAKFPKLLISLYQFKVEMEKRLTGEIKLWQTYQLGLLSTGTDAKDQQEFYTQLLDERRVPRKKKRVGKPDFEFKSRNKNNHFWDCKVYGLALFYYLQRSRAKKRLRKNRKVVEIK